MKNLSEKWSAFLGIACGPGSVVFSLLAVSGLIFAYFFKDNVPFSTLLSIVSSVLAGIAGNFIKDDYDSYLGKSTLEKKGRSALRNLETISTQLCNLHAWIEKFKNQKAKDRNFNFNEIDRHLSTIQLNISSGLEDWVDIIPELKEKIQENAEIEKKYKDLAQSYFNELLEKRKELITSNDEAKNEELREKITGIEKQIKSLKQEKTQASQELLVSPGWTGPTFAYSNQNKKNSFFLGQTCVGCGKSISADPTSVSLFPGTYCDECKKNLGLI